MTRILHVATVDWNPVDGIARAAIEVARHATGAEHHVVANRPLDAAAPFASATTIPAPAGLVCETAAFGRALDRVRPDVVHLHGGLSAVWLGRRARRRGIPVVVSAYRGATDPDPRHWREHRGSSLPPLRAAVAASGAEVRAARRALRLGRIAALVTPEPALAAALADHGRVVVAQGAASVADRRARWQHIAPTIVFAGKAESARGVDDLVEAFGILRAERHDVRLRLVLLPGPEAQRLLHRCAPDPTIDVTVGACDLGAELAGAQVAAYPFRWSATMTPPLAAAEAMAHGLPLVGTRAGCLAPLLEGSSQWVVPARAPVALAAALGRALADERTWRSASDAAVATIATRWSWADAGDRIDHLYATLTRRQPDDHDRSHPDLLRARAAG